MTNDSSVLAKGVYLCYPVTASYRCVADVTCRVTPSYQGGYHGRLFISAFEGVYHVPASFFLPFPIVQYMKNEKLYRTYTCSFKE